MLFHSINDYKHAIDYMKIAYMIAESSTCVRRKVGAIIVKNDTIISTGYNGSCRGSVHCADVECYRMEHNIPSGEQLDKCVATHGEANAIIACGVNGVSMKDGILYCTTQPCSLCTRMIINGYFKAVIFDQPYDDPMTNELLERSSKYVINNSPMDDIKVIHKNVSLEFPNLSIWEFDHSK